MALDVRDEFRPTQRCCGTCDSWLVRVAGPDYVTLSEKGAHGVIESTCLIGKSGHDRKTNKAYMRGSDRCKDWSRK